ncbi:30S ribosomal protein 3 chloroplastic [Phtheirospermum japonicum]|uniref:30S ribosomal protein 3, chloroplastic n=1 Tax=Phtheirospermum japonicum TaxID=374723 RepID=A0A830BSM3_9LAMI|nr:30S ribosomal protein 3 chloroplastic [Phtheirospermum japonicum]
MEKNIGIALDQVIPGGHGTKLRVMLESKQWISKRQRVVLLNQATDIINLWQESGGGDLS